MPPQKIIWDFWIWFWGSFFVGGGQGVSITPLRRGGRKHYALTERGGRKHYALTEGGRKHYALTGYGMLTFSLKSCIFAYF